MQDPLVQNPFVPVHTELSEEQKAKVDLIKQKALDLLNAMREPLDHSDPRCMATAKTKLEEAVMWAVKGVTNPSNHEQRFEK